MPQFAVEPKATVKLNDLYKLTTIEEVNAAVNTALKRSIEAKVNNISKANSREQKMAMDTLSSDYADTLLEKEHLRIDWVSYRIRTKLGIPRCFK